MTHMGLRLVRPTRRSNLGVEATGGVGRDAPDTAQRDTLSAAVRSRREEAGNPMAFLYRLEDEDGSPVEPTPFHTAVPNWKAGDLIPLPHRSLRVVAVRDDDVDQAPRLIVEDTEPGGA